MSHLATIWGPTLAIWPSEVTVWYREGTLWTLKVTWWARRLERRLQSPCEGYDIRSIRCSHHSTVTLWVPQVTITIRRIQYGLQNIRSPFGGCKMSPEIKIAMQRSAYEFQGVQSTLRGYNSTFRGHDHHPQVNPWVTLWLKRVTVWARRSDPRLHSALKLQYKLQRLQSTLEGYNMNSQCYKHNSTVRI